MRPKPRNPWWLVWGISGISLLAWFLNTYPPESTVLIASFFFLFFSTSFFLCLFIFNHVRRSLLLSLGLTVFFLLRLLALREPLYVILLIATLISLEFFLKNQ